MVRTKLAAAIMLAAAALLQACGGGGGSSAGTPVVGGDGASGGSGSSGDAGSAISVSVGASDQIVDGDTSETYVQEFTVQVVDSKGYPVAGATVTPTVTLPMYAKGYWGLNTDGAWARCGYPYANEDVNGNGSLDAGEDVDGDGKLAPRAADVSVSYIDAKTTDANGQVKLRIQYLQSSASWIQYALKASAKVSTTEGVGSFSDWLGVPVDQLSDTTSALPFQNSPYGAGLCGSSS